MCVDEACQTQNRLQVKFEIQLDTGPQFMSHSVVVTHFKRLNTEKKKYIGNTHLVFNYIWAAKLTGV